jgi:pantoate--beta-alanine ligase
MGALHAGHISLLTTSKEVAEITVCSIFVNPTQFNNKEDFSNYPRNLEGDIEQLEKAGCDIVFIPPEDDIYSRIPRLSFESGEIGKILEGQFRPGHFNGVLLVVSKLLNIVQPDYAFFGQKDLQQLTLVKMLVEDLCFPVEIISVSTIREKNGLAMSSRNARLNAAQLEDASCLYGALSLGRDHLLAGEGFTEVRVLVDEYLRKFATAKLEYYELLETESFSITEELKPSTEYALVIAAYFGEVRLIDNLVFRK